MADEDFHEIQLNGKQLVFLFMAGTVAAVVIFLSGLMVGRNLRAPRAEAAVATTEASVIDPTKPTDQVPPPTAATESSTPVSTGETLSYSTRLEAPTPVEETLRDEDGPPPAAKPAVKALTASPRTSAATAATPAPAADKGPSSKAVATKDPPPALNAEPAGNGWAVQVQAVKTRDEADAIARRLTAKGYPTFVTARGGGIYGVRVGKYDNKRDAEAVKARLEKDEQFKPWVTH